MAIKAIEFFSGIGGLHCGLKLADKEAEVVAAFDSNVNANQTYFYNFGLQPSAKGIHILNAELVDKFNANCWLLSPPCQPFTKGGKRLDEQDNRSEPLLNLIQILKDVRIKPEYLFLENVPNFETSVCRDKLLKVLQEFNYQIDEFLVSPIMVGIPNDRVRYYMCAKLSDEYLLNPLHLNLDKYCPESNEVLNPLSNYLDTQFSEDHFVKKQDILKRTNFEFDVVHKDSKYCSTFTKAYGSHHFFGSGSMLQTYGKIYDQSFTNEDLIATKPRYFTVAEVKRLHCLPEDFEFPANLTKIQQYKLLGNSLNCKIVGVLLKKLLQNEGYSFSNKRIKV